MLYIARALREEAEWLAPRLREVDRQEVYAATGKDPVVVLPLSVDISEESFTLRSSRQGDPIGIFGVGGAGYKNAVGHIGIPWLLAADELVEGPNAISLARISRPWVERLGKNFDVLANYVYAKNEVHIRWLKWAGFTVAKEAVPWGPFKAPFYPFVKRTRQHV